MAYAGPDFGPVTSSMTSLSRHASLISMLSNVRSTLSLYYAHSSLFHSDQWNPWTSTHSPTIFSLFHLFNHPPPILEIFLTSTTHQGSLQCLTSIHSYEQDLSRSVRPMLPWFDASVRKLHREAHCAERACRYRERKAVTYEDWLIVDTLYDWYCDIVFEYFTALKTIRKKSLSTIIVNCGSDQKKLFLHMNNVRLSQCSSCRLDPIPKSLFKEIADILAVPLLKIINVSISTGFSRRK